MNDDNRTSEDYRRLLATANKLETIQSNLESVIDFFKPPIVKLYTKLYNDCLKLIFECEFKLDQFRKAEELVWKRIYYDVYRFQKTKKQRAKRHDECLIESHFISGIGFYSSLIVKLRSHFKIYDVRGIIVPLNLALGPLDNFIDNQRLNDDDEGATTNEDDSMCTDESKPKDDCMAKEWARQAIYRSLIYMGDLARYLLETSQYDYRKLAFEFYKSASRNQPDHGLPFNQLATLSGGLNHNLGAVCNYMRCCLRPKPFEGAEGNMRKLFDLNQKLYEEVDQRGYISKISEVLSSKEPSQSAESMMRAIIVTFIKLTSDLWTVISGDNDELIKDEINEETRLFFENLREALELEPIVPLAPSDNLDQEFSPISGGCSFAEKPKYISPTIMYEFCSVSIMLIEKCQRRQSFPGRAATESSSDYVMNLVNTLALNVLHYSTFKCQKVITSKVQELRVSRQELLTIETALSTIDALDISSDTSEDEDQINNLIDLESSSDEASSSNQNNARLPGLSSSFNDYNELNSAFAFIYTKTYLPTIKIFCDWLLTNGDIISSNLQSFRSFCSELGDLVALLNDLRKIAETKDSSSNDQSGESLVYKHTFNGPAWQQRYPLSCDFPLLNLAPLKHVHEPNIDFNYPKELSDSEAGFITIQCIEAFFHALTAFLENKSFQ